MSKLCRLGEQRSIATSKKSRLRKQMRQLINEHISDPELNKKFHDTFNKVCSSWYHF